VRAIVEATTLPAVAIGGIELSMLADVVRSGARMAAIISAIARGRMRAPTHALSSSFGRR